MTLAIAANMRPWWSVLLLLWAAVAITTAFLPEFARAQDRALIVAIDTYEDRRMGNLPKGLAKNDAAKIEKLLTEKLGFNPDQIKVLRNEQATRKAILAAFESWLNPLDPAREQERAAKLKGLDESGALDDKNTKKKKKKSKKRPRKQQPKAYQSFFYFAGFGYLQKDIDGDETDGHDETLVPYDAALNVSGDGTAVTGMITDDEITAALARFKYRHTTLLLDTSHSGLVTRSLNLAGRTMSRTRAPELDDAVRSVATDEWLADHKKEGAFVDARIPGGSLQVWSAVSPTQTALIAGKDDVPNGLFTLLFAEGLDAGNADTNENGIISNVELLKHITAGSRTYCQAFRDRCEMGLKPRLDPAAAHGRSAWVDRKKVTHRKERQLSLKRLKDFLVGDEDSKIEIAQSPDSPVHVGTTGIRYEVVTSEPGYVILLNLTDKGELFQLYPNQYSGGAEATKLHLVQANTPLLVPEKSYGVTLSATEKGEGHIIAIMTPDPVRFDRSVTNRLITAVSHKEAIGFYLARLAAALNDPINHDQVGANTDSARWYVKVLPYEILPRQSAKAP